MMRFMIVAKANKVLPDMTSYNDQLIKAGVLLAAETLHPAAGTDLAGFWIIQARSREEALQWVSRIPDAGIEIELRQVIETSDGWL